MAPRKPSSSAADSPSTTRSSRRQNSRVQSKAAAEVDSGKSAFPEKEESATALTESPKRQGRSAAKQNDAAIAADQKSADAAPAVKTPKRAGRNRSSSTSTSRKLTSSPRSPTKPKEDSAESLPARRTGRGRTRSSSSSGIASADESSPSRSVRKQVGNMKQEDEKLAAVVEELPQKAGKKRKTGDDEPLDDAPPGYAVKDAASAMNAEKDTPVANKKSKQMSRRSPSPKKPESMETDNENSTISWLVSKGFSRPSLFNWDEFSESCEFEKDFHKLLAVCLDDNQSDKSQCMALKFLIKCFSQMERTKIRVVVMRLIGAPIWHGIMPARREKLLSKNGMLAKAWNHAEKKFRQADESAQKTLVMERQWFFNLFEHSLQRNHEEFLALVLELIIDLESQLPTRRFLSTLIDDTQFLSLSQKQTRESYPNNTRIFELLALVDLLLRYPADELTGAAKSTLQVDKEHSFRIVDLQSFIFGEPELKSAMRDFCLAHVNALQTPQQLQSHFDCLSREQLVIICQNYNLRTDHFAKKRLHEKPFLVQLLAKKFSKPTSLLEYFGPLHQFPVESDLWKENTAVQNILPKLNIQFLSVSDYLFRALTHLRYECKKRLQQTVENAVLTMNPRPSMLSSHNWTEFFGTHPHAVVLDQLTVVKTGKPGIGDLHASFVHADIQFSLSRLSDAVKSAWDALPRNEPLILVSIKAPGHLSDPNERWLPGGGNGGRDGKNRSFPAFFGIESVRGCRLIDFINAQGVLLKDDFGRPVLPADRPQITGANRVIRVALDPQQYQLDDAHEMNGVATSGAAEKDGQQDRYSTFNLLLRLDPENNEIFDAVQTVMDLFRESISGTESPALVPGWLQTLLLGYGDPLAAHFSRLGLETSKCIQFQDTIVDKQHLCKVFPSVANLLSGQLLAKANHPFAQLEMEFGDDGKVEVLSSNPQKEINAKGANNIRFTADQVQAIRGGLSHGLCLVRGPAGSGKKRLVGQLLSVLNRTEKNQRTLLIAPDNSTLDAIIEMVLRLGVDQGCVLKLTAGEHGQRLRTGWGKSGRLNYLQRQRTELLQKVDRLAASLGGTFGDVGYTCETAINFSRHHVRFIWQKYRQTLPASDDNAGDDSLSVAIKTFPFAIFFGDKRLPTVKSMDELVLVVEDYWMQLEQLFQSVEQLGFLEVLKSNYDCANYLLTKGSRVIAMTASHAVQQFKQLKELGFTTDNVVVVNAEQLPEIYAILPLVASLPQKIRRLILVGDELNRSKCRAKFDPVASDSNVEQSLFERLIRLGVPVVNLKQVDQRMQLRQLLLNPVDVVQDPIDPALIAADSNPGFGFSQQFIDCPEFLGQGETEPAPGVFQNIGEAEYVVAVYQYMRLMNYPANKIAILTPFRGQRTLIREVLARRCEWNLELFGSPMFVGTVDEFKNQRADYILLSLVRTDPRCESPAYPDSVVATAVSCARLGFYAFGSVKVWQGQSPIVERMLAGSSAGSKLMLSDKNGDITVAVEGVESMGKRVYDLLQPST